MSAVPVCSRHSVEKKKYFRIRELRSYWVCRECEKERGVKRRAENAEKIKAGHAKWRAENREKIKAWDAKYRAKNPEKVKARSAKYYAKNYETVKDRSKKWHTENPEKVKASGVKWRTNNPEKQKACTTRWSANNPEKVKAKTHARRARIAGNGGRYTAQEWRDLCDRYGNRCLACGATGKLSVDHVIPISKGGSNSIDNLQPLCKSCNSSKGTKTIDYRGAL